MDVAKRTVLISSPGITLTRTLLVACIYIITARLSQVFAIEPGNVTPVWIPSGIMLALALYYGKNIWPGVFLGAFFGNVWAYFSTESALIATKAVLSGFLNGVGDVIAIVVMAMLIRRFTSSQMPFRSLKHFAVFGLLGVIAGPLISAIFGVTGLTLFGFLDSGLYWYTLINWWVGDGVGVVLFTPFVVSLFIRPEYPTRFYVPLLIFTSLVFALLTLMMFELIETPRWVVVLCIMLVPVAFALVLQEGQRAVYWVQVVIACIAVVATHQSRGPFAEYDIISPLVALQLFIGAFSCIVFSITLLVHQRRVLTIQLQQQQKKLESLYRHDPLTGCWNRYRIEECLDLEISRLQRQDHSFAVFVIDIDDFKAINDCYGHLEGDRVLVAFAKVVESHIREGDLLGRWGGEEFVIVASQMSRDDAVRFADKLVALVADCDFKLDTPVTISVGYTLSQKGDDKPALLARADGALYDAKQAGKNQAVSRITR